MEPYDDFEPYQANWPEWAQSYRSFLNGLTDVDLISLYRDLALLKHDKDSQAGYLFTFCKGELLLRLEQRFSLENQTMRLQADVDKWKTLSRKNEKRLKQMYNH